ncbi:MAG: cyanophycinase [Planctomycetaceae bacterium]|nr:cyanophycinase [Planctomycetaceae bacterium]
MTRRHAFRTLLAFTLLVMYQNCVTADEPKIGPANGSLVIVGGGAMGEKIRERFIELAGGKDAHIVVIPTASGEEEFTPRNSGEQMWKSMGVKHVTMLHTYDREIADTDEFVEPLKTATGVWFGGGRQWRLADSYLNTKTHAALWEVLNRNGVIGGSSAGATIQGSYLARGDSKTNVIMRGDHQEGMSFLKNVAIDQHLLARNRQFDMLEIIEAEPHLLGIGLDEGTAIVVQQDTFEVIGATYVAVYDPEQIKTQREAGRYLPFFLLHPRQKFDLETRRIMQRGTPFDLPLPRSATP